MTDIGPQRAAPSSPARVQAQSRAAQKQADIVLRTVIIESADRLQAAFTQAFDEHGECDMTKVIQHYAEPPEGTPESWLAADVALVASTAVLWARCYKDCGPDEFRERANKTHKLLNVPQDCDLKDGAGDIGG